MKSQVNALLHVIAGIHKDVLQAYPALRGDLSKDFERIALYCRERGIGFFCLDLPHLESLLLKGLECGRLTLEGPISHRVSSKVKVPRLYSGLWLRIFDRDASLKQDVDVTALFFLRSLLVIGKKLELGCTHERTQAIVRAYHDIERQLRRPSLDWGSDSFTPIESGSRTTRPGDLLPLGTGSAADDQHRSSCGGDLCGPDILSCPLSEEEQLDVQDHSASTRDGDDSIFSKVHLVQASDGSFGSHEVLPLFAQARLGDRTNGIFQRREDQRLLNKIQRVADLIIGSFDLLDPVAYSGLRDEESKGIGFRHGPGAVAERLKNWEKSQFPNWPHKLQHFFPYEKCGTYATSGMERPLNHEVASRLIAVPKTTKGPRLIAAESTAHQWCQQLVLSFLFEQCRKNFGSDFIDFKDQGKSGEMVLQASLDRSLTTVDLSDASDRLSCWTVERVFRSNPSILRALHAARTRYLRDNISEVQSFLKLKKFASQGTAVTFPVMSLVMLCIALGAILGDSITWKQIWKARAQVRVFGDDIIIPTRGYARLVRAMELLELKVNVAKSYVSGHFRESCGVDGYMGYDVTPVKPKTLVADSPASCQAVVDISNNLYLKGLWNASTACNDLLPARLRREIRIVGVNDAGFRGLFSYSGGDESHLFHRWNSRLHRYEVRVWASLPRLHERPRDGRTAMLDFFASRHSSEQARIVSNYADVRKTRLGLRWEPQNTDARLSPRFVEARSRQSSRLHRQDCEKPSKLVIGISDGQFNGRGSHNLRAGL